MEDENGIEKIVWECGNLRTYLVDKQYKEIVFIYEMILLECEQKSNVR